jgi:ELWxxDGT repeat protein
MQIDRDSVRTVPRLQTAILGGFLLLAAPLAAAPYLVEDLNQGPAEVPPPFLGVAAEDDGVVYFFAADPAHGYELWRTDGTAAGTSRLTDICSGPCSSVPDQITAFRGQVYFSADDGRSGRELWVSDGRPGHAHRVRDICPGPCSSSPSGLLQAENALVFFATLHNRRQLWRSDGTPDGTLQLATICLLPAPDDPICDFNDLVSASNGDLVLYSGPHGDLWESDGTAAGTFALKRVVRKHLKASYRSLIPAGGFFFLWADDGLWRTDGTARRTFRLKAYSELLPGAQGFDPVLFRIATAGGLLYTVFGGGAMVRSDGTARGTFLLARYGSGYDVNDLTALPDRLVFAVSGIVGPELTAQALWQSRGTPETTVLFADLSREGFVEEMAAAGDRAVFRLYRFADGGAALWTTDGTAAGTRPLLADLGRHDDPMFAASGRVFFLAQSPASPSAAALWVTDGTAAGTRQVYDFGAGPDLSGPLDQGMLDDTALAHFPREEVLRPH